MRRWPIMAAMQQERGGLEQGTSARPRREILSPDTADSAGGDTWQLLGELRRHGVAFVLFGSGGARAHGAALPVGDIDICPDPEPRNLERLAECLDDLGARPRVIEGFTSMDEATAWRSRPASLDNLDHLYETPLGPLDVVPVHSARTVQRTGSPSLPWTPGRASSSSPAIRRASLNWTT